MSAGELAEFYVHTITVETFQGTSGYGIDQYAAPVTVTGWMTETRRLVRDREGQQVVSESQFITYPTHADLFVADSRVTFGSNLSQVIRTSVHSSGDLDLPDHIEVTLT